MFKFRKHNFIMSNIVAQIFQQQLDFTASSEEKPLVNNVYL